MKLIVTEHAEKRAKERLGLNKKSVQRQGELALRKGVPHSKTKGKLRRWVDHEGMRADKHASLYVVYNSHLFIFSDKPKKEERYLITILKVPTYLLKNINNYIK